MAMVSEVYTVGCTSECAASFGQVLQSQGAADAATVLGRQVVLPRALIQVRGAFVKRRPIGRVCVLAGCANGFTFRSKN